LCICVSVCELKKSQPNAGTYNRPNGFFFVFFLADLSYVGFVLVGDVLDIQRWKTNFTFCVQK
jgi:hypothetical protein